MDLIQLSDKWSKQNAYSMAYELLYDPAVLKY